MTYVIILSVWTTMFILMIMYMKMDVKQAKTIQDWNDKTQIEITAIRERLAAIERRVKDIEMEGRGTTGALGILADEIKDMKESLCSFQRL